MQCQDMSTTQPKHVAQLGNKRGNEKIKRAMPFMCWSTIKSRVEAAAQSLVEKNGTARGKYRQLIRTTETRSGA